MCAYPLPFKASASCQRGFARSAIHVDVNETKRNETKEWMKEMKKEPEKVRGEIYKYIIRGSTLLRMPCFSCCTDCTIFEVICGGGKRGRLGGGGGEREQQREGKRNTIWGGGRRRNDDPDFKG